MDFFRFLDNKETYFRAIQEAARREYSYQHLSEAIEPTIVRKKHGIGGKVMLRGPMCPNFLEEHVIGNVRRGRLCTNAKDPDYVYYFDRQDRLVKVDKNTEVGVCTEYILSEGDMRLGFLFTGEKRWKDGIYAVLLEDGHIGATIYHSVNGDIDRPLGLDAWTFEYGHGRPQNVTSCYIKEGSEHSPSVILQSTGYRLDVDEKGQIVKYHVMPRRHLEAKGSATEREFVLLHPIPPKIWGQTYGMI